MDTATKHWGFRKEAAPEVYWAKTCFLKPVAPEESRPMRRLEIASVLAILIGFPFSLVIAFAGEAVGKVVPFITPAVCITLVLVIIVGGIVYAILRSKLLYRLFMSRIRSRSERLFDPDDDCIYVGLEDPFTYDRPKIAPDDSAILRITPQYIQLEMTHHRVQLDCRYATVSLLHTAKSSAGVRLSFNYAPAAWSVVLSPIACGNVSFKGLSSAPRAKQLLAIFEQAGVKVRTDGPVTVTPVAAGSAQAQAAAAAVQAGPDEHSELMEARCQAVRQELLKKKKQSMHWLGSAAILLVSLYLFLHVGAVTWGLNAVLIILAVLVVHETGHFVGMKIFGYRNVKMFFIPMFGAAVSGVSYSVPSWKKALVMLMGPLPGIGLSLVFAIIHMVTEQDIYYRLALMFLILNTLNLLPIMPLDGGRFLHEVLLSRNRYVEMVAGIIGAALLLIVGFAAGDWLLRGLGIATGATIHWRFKLAEAADKFRKELAEAGQGELQAAVMNASEDDIPDGMLVRIVDWMHSNMPGAMKPKAMAGMVGEIWERIRILPPGAGATTGLMCLFCGGFVMAFISLAGIGLSQIKDMGGQTKIVQVAAENGGKVWKEQVFYDKKLSWETELTSDKLLFHGAYKAYDKDGHIEAEGRWEKGHRVGEWKSYDPNDGLYEVIVYKAGLPVSVRTLEDGKWKEQKWKDLSEDDQAYYRRENKYAQGPEGEVKPKADRF
jgi:Zn-dependent protease